MTERLHEEIAQMESLGYSLTLDNEKIKYIYGGEVSPDPAQIRLILENLKIHKGEVVEHLRKQAYFEAMFKQALEEINRQYEEGTIRHVREKHPALWKQIIETENRLSHLWLTGKTEDFKKSLEEWRNLNLQAIEIFREQGRQKTLFNLD